MTNFQPRTVQQIQSEVYRALASSNSALTDTSPGSGIYTLSRAIAIVNLEQDLFLNQISRSTYIDTAEGTDLDLLAADYGLSRKTGSPSSGYILVTSTREDVIIEPGDVFLDPVTQVQLQANVFENTATSFLVETRIPVVSSITGVETNLSEGTDLLHPKDSRVDSVVGTHRTPAGLACGPLSGGRDEESDVELRIRLIDFILNRRGTTPNAIQNLLLSDNLVDWVNLEFPLPGLIQVWIDYPIALSPAELERLSNIADEARPAGTVISVQQPIREEIDLELKLRVNSSSDQDFVSANVTNVAQSYVLGLPLEGEFSVLDLLNLVQNVQNVLSVEVVSPTENITAPTDSVIRIKDFVLSYELL